MEALLMEAAWVPVQNNKALHYQTQVMTPGGHCGPFIKLSVPA